LKGLIPEASSDDNTFITAQNNDLAFENMETELNRGEYILVGNSDGNYEKARIISSYTDAAEIETEALGDGDEWDDGSSSAHAVIAPPAGTGFTIHLSGESIDGGEISGWDIDSYEVGTTFIYDGNQESTIFKNVGSDNSKITSATQMMAISVIATSPYNPRISGGRVYIRRLRPTTASGQTMYNRTDPWQLAAEISMRDGIRTNVFGDWDPWSTGRVLIFGFETVATGSGDAGTNVYFVNKGGFWPFSFIPSPNVETYETFNGFPEDTFTLSARYKTAVTANRKVYIGNVKTTNEDEQEVVLGDAILKSPVNKFDSFPISRILEASVRDGDEIVKLEEYADRLLQFKKTKMTLINISQEVEFLEDTFIHKGVSHPAATCKTDFGIAWVNARGCYLYDGQKVNNLLERQGRQIIKEDEWDKFLRTDKSLTGTRLTPMIGYLPKKRQLIVFDDITNNSTANPRMYLYDMVTQSWTKGANNGSSRVIDIAKTNFVVDWDGDLVYAHTAGTVVKWDDAADSSTTMVMSTKDIDFGNPGQKKTVYKVIVTYQSGGATTHVQVDYGVDGDTAFTHDFTVPELPSASGWQTAELVPDALSQSSNIKSFRLRFATDGTVPAAFEINDVSIVYRLKGMR
jgi:hypothetical protein